MSDQGLLRDLDEDEKVDSWSTSHPRWSSWSGDSERRPASSSRRSRRRLCFVTTVLVVSTCAAIVLVLHASSGDPVALVRNTVSKLNAPSLQDQTWGSFPTTLGSIGSESYVLGPPTNAFRDNLRNDTKYITSWTSAGWTNDVMTLVNMIYLALLTDRVPILPPFQPSHLSDEAGTIDFGTVFDIPRLEQAIQHPVLEWHEVKNYTSPDAEIDDLGCWSVWLMTNKKEGSPRGNKQEGTLKLDVSYTAIPDDARLRPDIPNESHVSFWGLAKLAFSQSRTEALNRRPLHSVSKTHGLTLPPDEQLMCYDFIYFASAHTMYEWEMDFSPAWRFVGKHLHWSPTIQTIGDDYLRRAFGVEPTDPVPAYIGMHIRHTDFAMHCKLAKIPVPLNECFAPLSIYARRVDEIRAELTQSPHLNFTAAEIDALPVVVTSDDTTDTFWDEVASLGWVKVDHAKERTVEKYGMWYEPILDAYFQGAGVGFVGTDKSTMSLLAHRRVEDWTGGVGREVKWGRKDADVH